MKILIFRHFYWEKIIWQHVAIPFKGCLEGQEGQITSLQKISERLDDALCSSRWKSSSIYFLQAVIYTFKNSCVIYMSLLSSVVQTIINVINVIFISPIFLMSYFCVVLYNYFLQCNAGHEELIFSLVQEWKDWKRMQINFSSYNYSVET